MPLILPLGAFLVVRAISDGLIEPWYLAVLAAISIELFLQTVRAGTEITSSVRTAYRIASLITDRLPGQGEPGRIRSIDPVVRVIQIRDPAWPYPRSRKLRLGRG